MCKLMTLECGEIEYCVVGIICCSICVSEDGYVYVGMLGGVDVANLNPKVYRNENRDGTWATSGGFPETLHTSDSTGWHVDVVPLTGDKIVALYARSGTALYAKRWTGDPGGSWGAQKSWSIAIGTQNYEFDAVGIEDNAYIVAAEQDAGSFDFYFNIYEYNTNSYIGELMLYENAAANSCMHIAKNPDNDVYVFWANEPGSKKIYYTKRDYLLGTWGEQTQILDETPLDGLEDPTGGKVINVPSEYPTTNNVYINYLANTGAPYILKFMAIDEPGNVTTLPPTNVSTDSAVFVGEIVSLGTGTIIERGFEYGPTQAPTWDIYESWGSGFGKGVYTLNLVDALEPDSIYYVRAYIRSSGDVYVYGDWVGFITAQGYSPDDDPEGLIPDLPDEPADWYANETNMADVPGAEFINEIAEDAGIPTQFVWLVFTMFGLTVVGFFTYDRSKSMLAVLALVGCCLVITAAWGILGLWAFLIYVILGLAIVVTERQYGF